MKLGALLIVVATLTSSPAEAGGCSCDLLSLQPDQNLGNHAAMVAIDFEAASFQTSSGLTGKFGGAGLRGELSLPLELVFRLRLPGYLVTTPYGWATGVGDVELGLKRAFAGPGAATLSAGVNSALPTGDPHAGLGMEHLMIAPAVAAALPVAQQLTLVGGAVFLGAIPIGDHGEHHHTVFVAPHDPRELALSLGAGLALSDQLRLTALATATLSLLQYPNPVGSRIAATAGVAFRLTPSLEASAGAEAPLTRNRASDLRGVASLAFSL